MMKTLLKFIAFIVMVILSYWWGGFVGMKLWNWFVPSFIEAAPKMELIQCVGLMIVCSFFFKAFKPRLDKEKTTFKEVCFGFWGTCIYFALLLLYGWIVTLIM